MSQVTDERLIASIEKLKTWPGYLNAQERNDVFDQIIARLRSAPSPQEPAAGERIYTKADVEAMIAAAMAAKQMRTNQAERLSEFNRQTDRLIASVMPVGPALLVAQKDGLDARLREALEKVRDKCLPDFTMSDEERVDDIEVIVAEALAGKGDL